MEAEGVVLRLVGVEGLGILHMLPPLDVDDNFEGIRTARLVVGWDRNVVHDIAQPSDAQ